MVTAQQVHVQKGVHVSCSCCERSAPVADMTIACSICSLGSKGSSEQGHKDSPSRYMDNKRVNHFTAPKVRCQVMQQVVKKKDIRISLWPYGVAFRFRFIELSRCSQLGPEICCSGQPRLF